MWATLPRLWEPGTPHLGAAVALLVTIGWVLLSRTPLGFALRV
jgi:ABC-type uncharacterized transport system permease subunit